MPLEDKMGCMCIRRTYNAIQYAYGNVISQVEDVESFQVNVYLEGLQEGDYASDFVITKKDGGLMVRECVSRNHLMFYKLGLSTFYGPNFICDLGEISNEMLPYSKKAFEGYLNEVDSYEIISSDIWYEERADFSRAAIGTERVAHKEERGFELLQGAEVFEGRLLGGCLESLYDMISQNRYEDEAIVCERYKIFPRKEEWQGKILFIETCEEKPTPDIFAQEINALKSRGIFDVVNGIIVGKPLDEVYYDEYKEILVRLIDNVRLPIVYNVNFGHATPRGVLQYGAMAKVDMKQKKIFISK